MLIEYRNFQSQRRFGVEFEVSATYTQDELHSFVKEFEQKNGTNRNIVVKHGTGAEGWAESIVNNYWHVKYDSTCGPLGKKTGQGSNPMHHGWEIASYVCQGVDDVISVSNMAQHLADCRVMVNPNCGLHIHAETLDFTAKEMGVLYSHWLKIEDMILHSLPKHRKNNKYCKPVSKKFKSKLPTALDPDKLWNTVKPTNFYPHENPQKKVAINPLGFAQGLKTETHERRTIELRLPECILNDNYVQNWLILYLHFIDTVKTRAFLDYTQVSKNPLDEVFWILGLEEKDDDKFVILGDKLFQVKCWFLERLINNSSTQKIKESAFQKLEFITQI